ncbi:MAG: hypothetical protein ACI87E_002832 [Mariniblastus sp.]|jgi:hypothetical protein
MGMINQFDWQTAVALAIVATAIVVFAVKSWRTVFGASPGGCGTSCGSCPASTGNADGALKIKPLVQLGANRTDPE